MDAALVLVFLEDVGARDVGGQEVRRELHATEREIESIGERRNEQRLRETRHADEQRMPAREERDEHQVDDLLLTDDPRRDRLVERLARARRSFEQRAVVRRVALRRGRRDRRGRRAGRLSAHGNRAFRTTTRIVSKPAFP